MLNYPHQGWLDSRAMVSANFYLAGYLEVACGATEDPLERLGQARVSRARVLRGALPHIRLTSRLADLIYSMEITNTKFTGPA